jgi:hypothetical protein
MQQMRADERGVIRFRKNTIVDYLVQFAAERGVTLHDLAVHGFDKDDWAQFSQLIGYSVSGWGSLSYVTARQRDKADRRAAALLAAADGGEEG